MTAAPNQRLVERVAVAIWNTWNRVMVESGLHRQDNGGFYDPEPDGDSVKTEAHRIMRKAALEEAQAALKACRAEEMIVALIHVASWHEGEVVTSSFDEPRAAEVARAALAKLDAEPQP